jgi:hypothetical protein
MAIQFQPLGWYRYLSLGSEDCEPSVDPEVFGKEGVEVESEYVLSPGLEDCELSVDLEGFGRGRVEAESEYDLELRIGGNMGRPGVRHLSLLAVPNKAVRW